MRARAAASLLARVALEARPTMRPRARVGITTRATLDGRRNHRNHRESSSIIADAARRFATDSTPSNPRASLDRSQRERRERALDGIADEDGVRVRRLRRGLAAVAGAVPGVQELGLDEGDRAGADLGRRRGEGERGGGGGGARGGADGGERGAPRGNANGRGRANDGARALGWVAETSAPRALGDVLRPKANGERQTMPRMRLRDALGKEIERVLGGGVVPGGMILVGGDPGVGKSTILLQLAGLLGARGEEREGEEDGANESIAAGGVLYASGEESVEQVAGRAERMGIDPNGIYLYSATRLENILEAVSTLKPAALVVDSIQTVFLEDATGSPGSVSQVRECATALLHAAKTTGMPVFIIGHVTKSGDIAGPRVLEHIVDVVLYLEGDADRAVRVLRGHKNRYGSTDEVGVFQMSDGGMKPVASPSALFLGERILSPDVSAAPTVTVQGSRPFMLEVQALTNERADAGEGGGMSAPPIRTAVGLRFERMQLLLAVLAKFVLGRRLQKHDVFINIVGGMKLEDPSTDVAVALAIASSFVEKPLPPDMCFFGEVGLGGELRPVMQAERRIAEAATMGFKRVLLPEAGSSPEMGKKTGIELVRCNTLADALEAALDVKPSRSAAKSQPNGSWPSKFPKQKKTF